MKTAFERASDAVEDALASDDNHPDDIARAVLMAVRDPGPRVDHAVGRAAWHSGSGQSAANVWAAGIDAILAQP